MQAHQELTGDSLTVSTIREYMILNISHKKISNDVRPETPEIRASRSIAFNLIQKSVTCHEVGVGKCDKLKQNLK